MFAGAAVDTTVDPWARYELTIVTSAESASDTRRSSDKSGFNGSTYSVRKDAVPRAISELNIVPAARSGRFAIVIDSTRGAGERRSGTRRSESFASVMDR